MNLLTALIFMLSMPVLFMALFYFTNDLIKNSSEIGGRCILTVDEIKEAKKYAAMFSMYENLEDTDIMRILQMGRKYVEYLGNEKFEEIHAAIMQEKIKRHFRKNDKRNGAIQRLHIMMNASNLVASSVVSDFIRKITKSLGGDRNDGTASRY